MQTFFSSTDVNTLLEEGKDRNNFVSLIVNNDGKYNACITRKTESKVTKFYDFFGNKKSIEFTDTAVEYYHLDVIVETVNYDDDEFLNEKIAQLKKEKENKSSVVQTLFDFDKEPELPFIENQKSLIPIGDYSPASSKFTKIVSTQPNIELVDKADAEMFAAQIISGDAFKEALPIKVNEFIESYLELYKERFPDIKDFCYYIEAYIESILNTCGYDHCVPELASAVDSYIPEIQNEYIVAIHKALKVYME